jgi:hypothetical protein
MLRRGKVGGSSRSARGRSMATYDDMSPAERKRLMNGLEALTGLQEGPKNTLPDGTRYEYDPILKRTVEVTPSGERFPVTLVDGRLQRDSEKTDKRKGVLRRSPTPSGDTIPISSPKCVPESSKTGGTNEGER